MTSELLTAQGFAAGMRKLKVKFPRDYPSPEVEEFYYEAFLEEGLTQDEFSEAIALSIRERFFPSINEMLKFARGDDEQRGSFMWEKIIRCPWYPQQPQLSSKPDLDEAADRALKCIGGMYTVKAASDDRTLATLRKHFIEHYVAAKSPAGKASALPQLPPAPEQPKLPPLKPHTTAAESAKGLAAVKALLKQVEARSQEEAAKRQQATTGGVIPDENYFASLRKMAQERREPIAAGDSSQEDDVPF
ncbi:MAG TPA: hypothetical protein V6C65_04195 [Allocoleopsis sp.]